MDVSGNDRHCVRLWWCRGQQPQVAVGAVVSPHRQARERFLARERVPARAAGTRRTTVDGRMKIRPVPCAPVNCRSLRCACFEGKIAEDGLFWWGEPSRAKARPQKKDQSARSMTWMDVFSSWHYCAQVEYMTTPEEINMEI